MTEFMGRTYSREGFHPSTGHGLFDAEYRPADGVLSISTRAHQDPRELNGERYMQVMRDAPRRILFEPGSDAVPADDRDRLRHMLGLLDEYTSDASEVGQRAAHSKLAERLIPGQQPIPSIRTRASCPQATTCGLTTT